MSNSTDLAEQFVALAISNYNGFSRETIKKGILECKNIVLNGSYPSTKDGQLAEQKLSLDIKKVEVLYGSKITW